MTLSFNKFTIEASDQFPVDLRCTVCGRATLPEEVMRLDDAIEWAEQHECARMSVA